MSITTPSSLETGFGEVIQKNHLFSSILNLTNHSMANGEKITKAKAKAWVDRYKKKHDKDPKKLFSIMFDKDAILELLNEPGCEGLRIYNSYNDTDDLHFILVGTDASGSNLLPTADESLTEQYSVWDDGARCPRNCPPNDL